MNIRYATNDDFYSLKKYDHHIQSGILSKKIEHREILVAYDTQFIGWLRFSLFWDSIPFMNMLFLREEYRRKSIGRQLVQFWEDEMKALGFKQVMTSTQSNEEAQHFYRKLDYMDIGGFILPHEPFEILFFKSLKDCT